MKRQWTFILLLLVAGLISRRATLQHSNDYSGNTWSVVAVDPATGDVGVAAASCVPATIDAVAALVPGHGAAATQANFTIENRNRVFELLQDGRQAETVIDAVTQAAVDPQVAERQYGVVTLNGNGVQVASFTGDGNMAWAGHRQDQGAAVSVQGNLLQGEAVVANALAAFMAEANDTLGLPDRLMHALEAGSAAGGDRRCNGGDPPQTASAAFIMVARADEPPFAVPAFGDSQVGEPGTPWLYLSVTEAIGADNPLIALRQQYDSWRAEQVAVSGLESTETLPTPVATATSMRAVSAEETSSRAEIVLMVATVLTLVAMALTIWFVRTQQREW